LENTAKNITIFCLALHFAFMKVKRVSVTLATFQDKPLHIADQKGSGEGFKKICEVFLISIYLKYRILG